MPVLRLFIIPLLGLFLSACQALPTHSSGRVTVHGDNASVSIGFNDYERGLVHNYYRKKHKRVPPGLAKKNKLPPGLAKRDRLPPGLQGRYLPGDLERSLRPLPAGYVRIKVGSDIVLMNEKSRVVFDVIYGVD